MTETIDIITLVKDLPSRPRGRACVVLSRDFAGQKDWALTLAEKTNADHLDLLEAFVANDDLSEKLVQFQPQELFNYLQESSKAKLMIVSGMEFLKATWSAQASTLEQFASLVETWDKSPALCFVVQFDKALATRKFTRFRQHTFVIDQTETYAL